MLGRIAVLAAGAVLAFAMPAAAKELKFRANLSGATASTTDGSKATG